MISEVIAPIISIIALHGFLVSLLLRAIPALSLYVLLFSILMIIACVYYILFTPVSLFLCQLYCIGILAYLTTAAVSSFYYYKYKSAEKIAQTDQVPVPVKATTKNKLMKKNHNQ